MSVSLSILNTEIITDPKTLGISYDTEENQNNNISIANVLNTIGMSGENIEVNEISTVDMQSAVVGTEFMSLSNVKQRAWLAIVGLPSVPVKNSNLRSQVSEIWGALTITRSNLVLLQSRSASRSEVLFGEGVKVTSFDVHMARRET
jgi:hypothetical protein